MRSAYCEAHRGGVAHSVEAWLGDRLVGGAYGVEIGRAFCGESMFAVAPDASKVAFVHLVRFLRARGCHLIDCQMETDHLARFGAVDVPRAEFLDHLGRAVEAGVAGGRWTDDFARVAPALVEEAP
jgi:leucyl/phenylalanyl-tRNA--protein transferase